MKPFFRTLQNSLHSFFRPSTFVLAAMFIALNVILTRYLSIQTQFLRISFGFLPVAVYAMLFGPLPGAIAAVLGDVLGYILFPTDAYIPGLTVSAFIYGFIYGILLYNKPISLGRIIVTCLSAVFIVDFCLNTIWLADFYDQNIFLILVPRLIKSAVMLPVQIILLFSYDKVLGKRIQTQLPLQKA